MCQKLNLVWNILLFELEFMFRVENYFVINFIASIDDFQIFRCYKNLFGILCYNINFFKISNLFFSN